MSKSSPQMESVSVRWPSLSHRPTYSPGELARNLLDKDFVLKFLTSAALASASVCLIYLPAILPQQPFQTLLQRSWWPIKFLFLLGTGGAIYRPGFASVGMLGGLFFLHRAHAAIRNGARSWDVIRSPNQLLLNFSVALAVTFLYYYFSEAASLQALAILFAASLFGAVLMQFLDCEFYRINGASLISLNMVLAYYILIRDSGLSIPVGWLIAGISLASVVAWLIILASPRLVSIEIGEPPRQGVKVPFPRVDISWARGLAVLTIIGAAIYNALWNLGFPNKSSLNIYVLLLSGVVAWLVSAEMLYRLNDHIVFFADTDPLMLSKLMAREFWVITDVEPGSQTENFLKNILRRAQRYSLLILSAGVIGLGLLLIVTSDLSLKTALIIIVFPLFVVLLTQFIYSLGTTLLRMLHVVRQRTRTSINVRITAAPEVYAGIVQMTQPSLKGEHDKRLLELLARILPKDEEELKHIRKFIEESGVLEGASLLTAMRKVIGGSLKDSTGRARAPIETTAAFKIILKAAKELLLYSVVIVVLGAMVKQVFSVSQEGIIFLIIGTIISFGLPITVVDPSFRLAVSTIVMALIRKLSGFKKSDDS